MPHDIATLFDLDVLGDSLQPIDMAPVTLQLYFEFAMWLITMNVQQFGAVLYPVSIF